MLFVPETSVNITEQLQKIGQTAQDYRDAIVSQFKDMEVEGKKIGTSQLGKWKKSIWSK